MTADAVPRVQRWLVAIFKSWAPMHTSSSGIAMIVEFDLGTKRVRDMCKARIPRAAVDGNQRTRGIGGEVFAAHDQTSVICVQYHSAAAIVPFGRKRESRISSAHNQIIELA